MFRFEVFQSRRKVVTREEKLVLVVLVGIVECCLEWGQSKNQPAVAGINARELEHIAKKRPIGFGILGIDNDMHSIDQTRTPVTERGGILSLLLYSPQQLDAEMRPRIRFAASHHTPTPQSSGSSGLRMRKRPSSLGVIAGRTGPVARQSS